MSSKDISKYGHKCQFIRQHSSELGVHDYNLCDECYRFLVDKEKVAKNTWPGFLWRLLSGGHQPKFSSYYNYYDVYSGEHLWKAIPHTMRAWWLDTVRNVNNHGEYPYRNCDLTTPPSFFEDRSNDLREFQDDLDSGEQSRLMKALNNEQIMNANVLCPFGCSEYCRTAEYSDWEDLLQRYLLKVILPLNKKKSITTIPQCHHIIFLMRKTMPPY